MQIAQTQAQEISKHYENTVLDCLALLAERKALLWPQSEDYATPAKPIQYPFFKQCLEGDDMIICGMIPGFSKKDIVVSPRGNQIRVEGTRPANLMPFLGALSDDSYAEKKFRHDFDFPSDFGKPVLRKHVVRDGIIRIVVTGQVGVNVPLVVAQLHHVKKHVPKHVTKKAAKK